MRRSLLVCAAALCVGCGSKVYLGGGSHQGPDAGTHHGDDAGVLGTGGAGNVGNSGMDAGVAGAPGMDAGVAGSPGMDAGNNCSATVLAQSTFPTQYWGLALDADNVYWFSFDSTGSSNAWLDKAPKAGGKPQRLAAVSVAVEGLASSGADVFCATAADPGNGISRIDKSTGKVSTLVGNATAQYVAANTTTVFFIAGLPGGNQAGDELDTVPRGGGTVRTLSSVALSVPSEAAGPVADGIGVYWIKPGQPSTLEYINPALATPPVPAPFIVATGDFVGGTQTLALDSGKLFYLEHNGSTAMNGTVDVKSVSTTGGQSTTVAQNTNAVRVIADSGEVYWRNRGTYVQSDPGYYLSDASIKKMSMKGGAQVTLVKGLSDYSHGPGGGALAVDATYLYWVEYEESSGTYRIMRTCR